QAVVRLVPDGVAGRAGLHLHVEAAALDHEIRDHAVEDGAVVVTGADVLQELLDGLGRALGVQLDDDAAAARGEANSHCRLPSGWSGFVAYNTASAAPALSASIAHRPGTRPPRSGAAVPSTQPRRRPQCCASTTPSRARRKSSGPSRKARSACTYAA